MRLSVRQQLSLILILSGCIGLAVLAIATWVTNEKFVLGVSGAKLASTASLKASEIAFNLKLVRTATTFITTRARLQNGLNQYNNASATLESGLTEASSDLMAALSNMALVSDPLILQVGVFSRNTSGPMGSASILNVTSISATSIELPWVNSDGQVVHLGDSGTGYPPALYPNLTVIPPSNSSQDYLAVYNDKVITPTSSLVLGPMVVNETYSMLSITIPVLSNIISSTSNVLGWVTVVCNANLLQYVLADRIGLGNTGQTLIFAPVNQTNEFGPEVLGTVNAENAWVRYLYPLNISSENAQQHPSHMYGSPSLPFPASAYPAVEDALLRNKRGVNDFGEILQTTNEAGRPVSVGYSMAPTDMVDWVIVIEQDQDEVWQPISQLRSIILACLFSVIGFLLVVSFPVAHWFVLPIIRLRAATEDTVENPIRSMSSCAKSVGGVTLSIDEQKSTGTPSRKEGLSWYLARWRDGKLWPMARTVQSSEANEKRFRIPGRVRERKQWIQDEMSDLVTTFNEMSDELYKQYTKLEDRVRQRTAELETSKKAAEAANESKTLFVANVSHELKTPLNGILGMTAVCMEESDITKLKASLGIIYRSGELLLRTLSDLLTFSTNQVGHQILRLDEKDFIFGDIETQIFSLFATQAMDNDIDLNVKFGSPIGQSPGTTASLRDNVMWGDMQRIMQIIINLISNSLKFTPPGGRVTLLIKVLDEECVRRRSIRPTATLQTKKGVAVRPPNMGTANFINPRESSAMPEPSAVPPGKDVFIEFEVSDTGSGISENMQQRIFEPFVQADAGLNRKHSGTGLGLSICMQLANLLKGSISLKSSIGHGSTFTVKIPLRDIGGRSGSIRVSSETVRTNSRRASEAGSISLKPVISPVIASVDTAAMTETTPEKKSSGMKSPLKQAVMNAAKQANTGTAKASTADYSQIRVLAVDDNKINLEVIRRLLQLESIHNVAIAEDGQAALDLVRTGSSGSDSDGSSPPSVTPYDLIFMDVQMPIMDGLQSTRRIRELGFRQPIIALTAYAEQSNIDDCYNSGMDYFLSKPIRRPQLKKVLAQYCQSIGSPPDDGNDCVIEPTKGSLQQQIAPRSP